MYVPSKDTPCRECMCDDGIPTTCVISGCRPPSCPVYERIEGECCQVRCIEAPSSGASLVDRGVTPAPDPRRGKGCECFGVWWFPCALGVGACPLCWPTLGRHGSGQWTVAGHRRSSSSVHSTHTHIYIHSCTVAGHRWLSTLHTQLLEFVDLFIHRGHWLVDV